MVKNSKKESIQIAPSILAGDFGHLADEAKRIADSGADMIHVDVMDGHFVPNLTFGHQVVAALNRSTDLFLDVHIMVYNPFDYVEKMVEAGADRITFHLEATEDVEDTLQYIRRCNVEAGLAFCPATSMDLVPKYLDKCDLILLMTVNPGFGGQKFMPEVLEKIQFVRDVCNKLSLRKGGAVAQTPEEMQSLPPLDIQVDGGIDLETAPQCVEAGANILVAGTHLFKAEDMGQAVLELRQQSEKVNQ